MTEKQQKQQLESKHGFDEGTPGKVQLAVFDFDGTCIKGNSPARLVKYLGLHGKLSIYAIVRSLIWGISYKMCHPQDSVKIRNIVFKPFRNKPKDEVDAYLRKFYEERLEPRFRVQASDAMKAHAEAGHQVMLASASFEPMIRPALDRHPISYLLSTKMCINPDETYSDQVDGEPMEGDEKIVAINRFADEMFGEGNWELGWAYSDHYSDEPLLGQARNPMAVNPHKILREHAQEKGWEILDWIDA